MKFNKYDVITLKDNTARLSVQALETDASLEQEPGILIETYGYFSTDPNEIVFVPRKKAIKLAEAIIKRMEKVK